MTEMRERVAKAIEDEVLGASSIGAINGERVACAAIAAMREYLNDHYIMDWPSIIDEALK